MSDHDRIIMLESENQELKSDVMILEQMMQDSAHLVKIFNYFPESVWLDMLSVLEYGQGTHKPDEWKSQTVAYHLGHAYKHFEDYLRGETIDHDTGKSVLNNIIIRVCMAAALEKEK